MKTLPRRKDPSHPGGYFEEIDPRAAGFPDRSRHLAEPGGGKAGGEAEWKPPVNIAKDDLEYLLTFEFPGLESNDIKVDANRSCLRVIAKKTLEPEEENKRFFQVERDTGHCHRAFRLPGDADERLLRTESRDGLLLVRIPRRPMMAVALLQPKERPDFTRRRAPTERPAALTPAAGPEKAFCETA